MYLNILLLVILVVALAFLFREGLWSNAITLINVITAALVAVNYFEPASRLLSDLVPFMDYNWDVLLLGVIFAVVYLVLNQLAVLISKHQVRFHPLVDRIGSPLVSLWIGWVLVCFVMFALHTSPLARNFLSNSFQPEQRMFFGLAPDRQWLGFITKVSDGGSWGTNETNEDGAVSSAFDPTGVFMIKYASRRQWLQKHVSPFAGAATEP